MKKLAKKLATTTFLATAICGIAAGVANAELAESADKYIKSDFEIKLNGFAHFQAAYRNQSKLKGKEKNVSANNENVAFYNDTAFVVHASKDVNDCKYGAKIVLVPTAKRKGAPTYNGSHIFVETPFGRFEAGSPISASSNMFTDAFAIVAGTGDDWSRYAEFESMHFTQDEKIVGKTVDGVTFTAQQVDGINIRPTFVTFSDTFLDSKLLSDISDRKFSSEPSRAISYYTPKFEIAEMTKLQIGVSYIPDSSNTGADSPSSQSSGTDEKKIAYSIVNGAADKDADGEVFKFDRTVKNSFTGGICIEQGISDGVDLKLSFTGEYGKAAGKLTRKSTANAAIDGKEYKLSDLRTYNIGGILNLGNFSFAGSYGSLGKSLTNPVYHRTGRETKYYSGAMAHKYGPFNTSISYFHSDQFKNTVDAVAIGTDFKLAPGLKPYAEIATFSLKGKPEYFPELDAKKTRGTVALLGMKLSL